MSELAKAGQRAWTLVGRSVGSLDAPGAPVELIIAAVNASDQQPIRPQSVARQRMRILCPYLPLAAKKLPPPTSMF